MAHWRKIKKARQRLVLCRLMIDMMRTVHGAYAPADEPFGTRLETFFIALCVALDHVRSKGKIKFFNESKGYGFFTRDDGSGDVFVHRTDLPADIGPLYEGRAMDFDVEMTVRG